VAAVAEDDTDKAVRQAALNVLVALGNPALAGEVNIYIYVYSCVQSN